MALIGGALIAEELVKDIIIPWWITTEIIAGSAVVGGLATGAIVEEVK